MSKVSVSDVSTIARLAAKLRDAEWVATRTRSQLWIYTKATAKTLARLEVHGLADNVRLPQAKVTQLCWEIFKTAKAAHAAAKAAEAEAEMLAEYDELRVAEHVAQLDNDVALFV
jgi:hypothetical protein